MIIRSRILSSILWISLSASFYSCASTPNSGTTNSQSPNSGDSKSMVSVPVDSSESDSDQPVAVQDGASDAVLNIPGIMAPRAVTADSLTIKMPPLPQIPEIPREFRGVWITTVNNGDWPSRQDLSTAEQQAELLAILDRAHELNMNAVILQVRPTADALYESVLEPWSVFLTGKQGRAPDPPYDPLEFAVREAHARRLELHAWINPFRASFGNSVDEYDAEHVAHSGLVVKYGGYLWLDPGNPDAIAHTLNVILDILVRYDIDGIHMDDYFYPYPVQSAQGEPVNFPDDASWTLAGAEREGLSRADWRRRNVDRFVETVHDSILDIKPWVKFGISPFGIWQPGYPSGIEGFNPREALFADSRRWLREGWVDYFSPQLYWAVDAPAQSYTRLLSWWVTQNRMNRHLWPGNFASRINLTGDHYWGVDEVLRQIDVTRKTIGASGNIFFRMSSLMPASHHLGEQIKEGYYQTPVLIPASPWLQAAQSPEPELTVSEDMREFSARVHVDNPLQIKRWLIWRLHDGIWDLTIRPGWNTAIRASLFGKESAALPEAVAVAVVDRIGRCGVVVSQRIIQ